MKSIDIFEKKRVSTWLFRFVLITGILLLISFTTLTIVAKTFFDLGTYELFQIVLDDFNLFEDVSVSIWEELPHNALLVGLFTLITVIILFFSTHKQQKIIRKKLKGFSSKT